MFLPPEAFGAGFGMDDVDQPADLEGASAWDIATRYHEFKAKKSMEKSVKLLRKLSAEAILERARTILGSVVHPMQPSTAPLPELPYRALDVELDIEETLENSPLLGFDKYPLSEGDLIMSYQLHRGQPVILSVDTSLSMTGEKLALTAVALAVVLLQFPEDPVGIIAFENEAKVLKRVDEQISLQQLVERFLDVPAQGYTHLEDGLRVALALVRSAESTGRSRPPSVVLVTDGKYTAGKDPGYLAPRFPQLMVLKMGHERASRDLCEELARRGHGALREVAELESLPSVMYAVVKDLLRGPQRG